MERRKKRVQYRVAGGGRASTLRLRDQTQGKKRRNLSRFLPAVVVAAAVIILLSIVLRFVSTERGRSAIGRVTRIGATVGQNVAAFGDGVIFYDGATLRCVSATGGSTWSYQIGTNADYNISGSRIVAWSGNDLYILNDRGRLLYNNKMTEEIQFAAVGEEYAAVFCGDEDDGIVTVINSAGQTVDKITITNLALQNIGFFKAVTSSSGVQQTELMWILGLNTTGTVINMELQTYQPGRLSIGKTSLGEHIAYKVLDDGSGNLDVVTTREIQHYNYRGVSTGSSSLIYGYTLHDSGRQGDTLYRLLIPEQEMNSSMRISAARLMTGSMDRMLHLPVSCLDVRLGTRAVYGFSENAVYACRFGETNFESYAMPIQVTSVLDMMANNRVVVASGNDIYIVELPM